MPLTDQDEEDRVRVGVPNLSPDVTPECAIVGVDTNSMAGSGVCIFGDFAWAVCWFWGRCEEVWGSGEGDAWIPDDEAPPELRQGRKRFRTLLARFDDGGYTRAMADEFRDIVHDIQDGDWCYLVGGVQVLPTDLDEVLAYWRDWDWDDPDEYADAVKKAARNNMTVPPGPPAEPFDLANPDHFAALTQYLAWYCDLFL